MKKCLDGKGISKKEALVIIENDYEILDLIKAANEIRNFFFGNKISLCSIINAKSGLCANDCSFCAQSAFHKTGLQPSNVISCESALETAKSAIKGGSINIGLVTSGVKLSDKEFSLIIKSAEAIKKNSDIGVCASLGELDEDRAKVLYQTGIRRYHHNLETSRNYYPKVCSTYDYSFKLRTIRNAVKAGLEICCGGIFGLGERWEDRIDMAMEIRNLGATSIPLNFLNPIKGTPLQLQPLLPPLEALKIISIFRLIFPDKTIKVCGGRERILRDMQSWMFYAGANGTMIGNYLTTAGRPVGEDLRMLSDLGLEPARLEDSIYA